MRCTQCGTENSAEAGFCQKCGTSLQQAANQSDPKTDAGDLSNRAGAIWNPNATANWSYLFTPAFGSYLQMLNWKTLGRPEKAASAKVWFVLSLLVLTATIAINVVMSDDEKAGSAANGLAILYLLVWYFAAGRGQAKYVKDNLGTAYPRKPWTKPLVIAVVALAGYMAIAAAATVVVMGQVGGARSVASEISALASGKKDIPSCGDAEVTNLVGQILAETVTNDTGLLEAELKKRIHFAVEQPVILTHDEKISRYSCKGVATYKVSDVVLEKLHRSEADKSYQAVLWKNWRRLMGLYSVDDVSSLVTEFTAGSPKSETKKEELRAEIAQVLGIEKNFSDPVLMAATMAYPGAQRNSEIQKSANLMDYVLQSTDEKTKKVSVEVHYTISKIDGQGADKEFKVEVDEATLDDRPITGIQNLEVLLSAAQMAEQPAFATASVATTVKVASASNPTIDSWLNTCTPFATPMDMEQQIRDGKVAWSGVKVSAVSSADSGANSVIAVTLDQPYADFKAQHPEFGDKIKFPKSQSCPLGVERSVADQSFMGAKGATIECNCLTGGA